VTDKNSRPGKGQKDKSQLNAKQKAGKTTAPNEEQKRKGDKNSRKRKNENFFSPLKPNSKKSRGNNPSLNRNLFPDDESSTSEEEDVEDEDEQASEENEDDEHVSEEEEEEQDSTQNKKSQKDKIEALKLRGQIAKKILRIREIIHHSDSLESNNVDPTSFLVDGQVVLHNITHDLADLVEIYDQYIGIYSEFSFDHSIEIRDLIRSLKKFTQASFGDLYNVWHHVRQDFQAVMDIDLNIAYYQDAGSNEPDQVQTEQDQQGERLATRKRKSDRSQDHENESESDNETICGSKKSKKPDKQDLLKGSTLTMAEKKTLYAGCKAGTAMRIEEAGTGPSLKLTGSIFADYVQKEVFISATKFSGEEIGSYHLHHLMSRLNAIHVANNIPYHRKMLALSLGLEGKAYNSISSYMIEPTELKYKQALCKLFKLYGDESLHQSTILNVLQRETLPNTSLDTQVEYLSRAETAIEHLLATGESPDVVYSTACHAIFRVMPDRIEESRSLRVAKCGFLISDRDYFKQNYEERFKEFVDWMYARRNNEVALRGTAGLENQESSVNLTKEDLTQRIESLEKKDKQHITLQNNLRNKIKELESLRAPASARAAESQPGPRSPKPRGGKGFKKPEFVKRKCPFCGSEEHSMYQCKLTIDERQQVVKDKGLCPVCLKPGHQKKDCRTAIKCAACFDEYGEVHRARHNPGICKNNARKWKAKLEAQKAIREAASASKKEEPHKVQKVEAGEEKPPESSGPDPPPPQQGDG
jgi:hypothetical protein